MNEEGVNEVISVGARYNMAGIVRAISDGWASGNAVLLAHGVALSKQAEWRHGVKAESGRHQVASKRRAAKMAW